jgi:putative intracellular protease/amidase/uncharacterized protein (DUF952 family)
MRWLYHLRRPGEAITARDGFIHCSFAPDVAESARIHFSSRPSDRSPDASGFPSGSLNSADRSSVSATPSDSLNSNLEVARIDPRRLDARVEVELTGRGPMPHVYGTVTEDAIREVVPLADFRGPDRTTGTRTLILSFEGMTLLDLVGVYDPIARLSEFDPEAQVEIAGLTDRPYSQHGATFETVRVRPPLDEFDLLIVPGGLGMRPLLDDREILAWLWTRPPNRMIASVCTGALLLGQAGLLRGRRATTHHGSIARLPEFGARHHDARVVEDGCVITAGGVSSGLDLGLHLVEKLAGSEVRTEIARRMEYRHS